MLHKIQAYILKHNLLKKDKPVIAGLSGGADSVALLAALTELGYSCIAAHCNFHLRGEESDRDEHFAETFAKTTGVPFYNTGFDTKAYASENHISIEMAARELRYKWFEELRNLTNAQAIAVAHHKDDNAETLLLNLTRGTGIRGVRGMCPKNGNIIRPMLGVSREEILAWLSVKGLSFVTDSSNLSEIYNRNFIRLRIIPMLEQLNPSVKEALARTAEHLYAVEQIYQSAISQAKEKIMTDSSINIAELLRHPSPETILYELLIPFNFSRQTVEDLFSALNRESGKTFYSPTHRLVTSRGNLFLSPLDNKPSIIYTIEKDADYLNCNNVEFFISKIDIEENFKPLKDKDTACLDCDKLKFPLTLRHWKAGDWFIPLGMNGRKKLSDLFTDLKYSQIDKENVWLLCSGQDIVWIAGERIDNRYRIKESTTKGLLLRVKG